MEYENQTFDFLDTEAAQKYFADTDYALKAGRHIQYYGSDVKLWEFIDDYFEPLKNYYDWLYSVILKDEFNDTDKYYYIDFYEEGKGKLGKDRTKYLEDKHVIFGILLLNMYKEKYFEKKEFQWEELEQVFDESEQKDYWAMLFFGKKEATPTEIEKRKEEVRKTLNFFHELGWISWIDKNEIAFGVLPSIDRIAKLYSSEINNIEKLNEFLNV